MSHDLPNRGWSTRPQNVQLLFKMLAAVQGQKWNALRLGQSMGLAAKPLPGYLDLLTARPWVDGS